MRSIFIFQLSKNLLHHISSIMIIQILWLLSALPLACSSISRLTYPGSKKPLRLIDDSFRNSSVLFLMKSDLNHSRMGTPNQCLFRFIISSVNSPFIDCLTKCFNDSPFTFRLDGTEKANSTNLWSRKGTRASRDFAIVILSTCWSTSLLKYVFK